MMHEYRIMIEEKDSGQRIDRVLSDQIQDLSRSRIQMLIDEGGITVNGEQVKASYRVHSGEIALVVIPDVRSVDLEPEDLGVPIIYEDDDLVVVDKPRGMVVHPGAGVDRGTLVHALMFQCRNLSGIGGELRPGIVHRLDKGTSGAMIVAKNDVTHERLAKQFATRNVEKVYWAVVAGNPVWQEEDVDAPLSRHPSDRKRMAIVATGRPARTRFRVMAHGEQLTLIAAHPLTGRTHQIRVHLQHLGIPVLGDVVYGKNANDRFRATKIGGLIRRLDGFCLHARSIRFEHPTTGEQKECTAPMPADMLEIMKCGAIALKVIEGLK